MKVGSILRRRILPVLVLLVAGFLATRADQARSSRFETRHPEGTPSTQAATTEATPAAPLDLDAVPGVERRRQIARVVASMDETGNPPAGVFQGGRRGVRQGVFLNAERRLPIHRTGYWIESDVWPRSGPRGPERLVFGEDREVYWTSDHYKTFVRLR